MKFLHLIWLIVKFIWEVLTITLIHVLNWGKSILLWVLIRENRQIGIRYTRKGLEVFEAASKLTKTSKDDKAIAYIQKQFEKAVAINNQFEPTVIDKAAKVISDTASGLLKDVRIDLQDGKPSVKLGIFNIK